jgi:hypothetical protein
MWTKISARKHTYTVYAAPEKASTFLLEGEVRYGFKEGGEGMVRWVAKAEFEGEGEGEGEGRRLGFYQVFLDAGSR